MTTDPSAVAEPLRAYRSADDRMVAGVAGGLAAHLGVSVLWVRGAFVAACAFSGLGVVMYGALWMFMPMAALETAAAPGLEAATRQGRRPPPARTLRDMGLLVALGAIALGGFALGQQVWSYSIVIWPVLIGAIGVGVLWWQADEAQRARWRDSTNQGSWPRAVAGDGTWADWTRLAAGTGLLLAAILVVAAQSGRVGLAREVVIAGTIGIVGIALTLGPWLLRMAGELTQERAARIRQQERADVAAHLHDSVLQTLALIQKHSQDPRTVATLARAQERDLRSWLYQDEAPVDQTLAVGLRTAAAEVEDAHGVPIEVVVVGDLVATERTAALIRAAREAMVNAAKHSGAPRIDVYAEFTPGSAEVFIRDRGVGFDPEAVTEDRLGVRNSITGRMERHGGVATLRTEPGAGTEVRLQMTLEDAK